MDYAGRIERVRLRMEACRLNGVLIANDASWEYLTGLPRGGHDNTKQRQNSLEFACLLVTQRAVTAFCPRLCAMGFSWRMEEFPQVDKLVLYPDADLTGEAFDREIRAQGLDGKVLGVTRDISSLVTLRLIERHGMRVKDFSSQMDAMRAIKDAEEIERMRYASRTADQIYYDILPMLKPGTPIREIEREIERLLEQYDCSFPSFSAEVLNFGPKAGSHLGQPYGFFDREHTIAFDYGVVYRGYCSDFGRTVFLREPEAKLRRYYELVVQAQEEALKSCTIGVTRCSELNAACHRVMKDAGLDEFFIHRMGHGIGLDVHERPFMAEGEDMIVQPGMCFTDEPSLFVPGEGLVRVEDVVLATEHGFEYLNQVTRELVVLEEP